MMETSDVSRVTCRTIPVVVRNAKMAARGAGRMEKAGTFSRSNASWVYSACVGRESDGGLGGGTRSSGEVLVDIRMFKRLKRCELLCVSQAVNSRRTG